MLITWLVADKDAELKMLETLNNSLEIRLNAKDYSLDQWKENCVDLQKALEEKDKLLAVQAKEMTDYKASVGEQLKLHDQALQDLSKKIERLERDLGRKADKINYLMLRGSRKQSLMPPTDLSGLYLYNDCLLSPAAGLITRAMNASYYMTGGVEPAFNPETFLWRMPSEIESHCRSVAVDARARMLGIARSWYPTMDMYLIEAASAQKFPKRSACA